MELTMSQTVYACDGSLALSVEPCRLRLVEGGLSKHGSSSRTHRSNAVHANLVYVVIALMAALAITWYATDCFARMHAERMLDETACETIIVGEGDTLWGIAESRQIDGCTTEQVVRHIRQINGLESSMLREGSSLRVPRIS